MTISKLYLAINEDSELYSAQSDFDFEVSFITEYISKIIKKNKFKYEDAIKLIIYIDSGNKGIEYKPMFNVLVYNTTFSYLDVKQLDGHDRTEKILDLIKFASSKYETYIPGIKKAILEAIELFKNNSYKNIWLFKKKQISGVGQAELICELDRQFFTLTLLIINKENVIYRKEILRTKPSSIIYNHRFKDILIKGSNIVVVDKFDEPLYQISISDLSVIDHARKV